MDAELDFHKKLNSGEDTTDLRKKLNQLQVEVRFVVNTSTKTVRYLAYKVT